MQEDDDILKKPQGKYPKESFKVPDNYFDYLPGRVLNKIKNEEQVIKERKSIFVLIKPQLALAASFIALFMLTYAGFSILIPDRDKNDELSQSEIYAELESELYNIDENSLYEMVYNTNEPSKEILNDLSREEIIEYLNSESSVDDILLTEF
ncbi:MAG: hypothetical protein JXA77_13385 [Bacteroidales bacterium]|nr:hypothetical protein [Bacteroidales bacterium]MBN2818504.1 hypothetical protein [Bacteroidales bacterium]